MKRVLIYVLGAVAVTAAAMVYLYFRPNVVARVFFGAEPSPAQISIKDTFDVPAADRKTEAIVEAATLILNSLDNMQRRAAVYGFRDNAQRSNWSNFPEGMVPRGGVNLGVLSAGQRENLDRLLEEFLSEYGTATVSHQLAAEDLLIPGGPLNVMKYGSEFFYTAFLGEPSTTEPWMFQFGGHHLALNATVFGPDVSFSPMLTGGQPLHLRVDDQEFFILQRESNAAHAFMSSLTEEQQRKAVRAEQPINIVLGPGEFGESVAPEGIGGSELTDVQKALLLDVMRARLALLNDVHYAKKIESVAAEINDTHFGWWGQPGVMDTAYFRVTSPSLVIEYWVENEGGRLDHAHSIYRDLHNDYGSRWIGRE